MPKSDILPEWAISLKQPWAWAIFNAGKDVENRTWPTKMRGRVAVHASKGYDLEGHLYLQRQGVDVPSAESQPRGVLVGEVTITDCILLTQEESAKLNSPWAFGPYCFLLADPRQYAKPIAYKGSLGFFKVEVRDVD